MTDTDPGLRKRVRALFDSRSLVRIGLFLIPAVFLLVIIGASLVFFAWGSVWSTTPGFGGHFTLSGYWTALTSPVVHQTLQNTLILAVVGTAVAVGIGLLAVVFTLKMDIPRWLASVVSALMIIQLLLPNFIQALAWQFYLGPQGPINRLFMALPMISEAVVGPHNIWAIAFIFGTHYAGLVYLLTSGAVKSIPPQLEEIALVSGASQRSIFSEIDLQLVVPSVLIAGIIVFVRGIQSFGVPLVLGVRNNVYTLATLMYFELNEFPRNFTFIAAVGIIILLLSLWLLLIQRRISGSKEQYETLKGAGEDTGTLRFYENRPLAGGFLALLVFAYLMPIAMIVLGSVQRAWVGLRFQFVQWDLQGYRTLLGGERTDVFVESVTNATMLGVSTALLALFLAVIVSYLSIKTDWKGGTFLNYLSYAPLAIPGIVVATALQWIILEYHQTIGFLYGSLYILVAVYAAKFLIYGVRAANSSLRSVGSNLGEVGSVLGASTPTVIREIYAPLMGPGLLAGFIIIFIDTTKSLSIPLILGGNEFKIVQNAIWLFITESQLNVAAAYSVILLAVLTTIYMIAYKLGIDITSV